MNKEDHDIKMILDREYQDGDIVEFDFEPNSLDVHDFHTVTLVGVISGILIEEEGRIYNIQIRDNGRKIFGNVTIPEDQINRRIDQVVM